MSRELLVNGETIVLSDKVINELHRQERIEDGKRIAKKFVSKRVYNKKEPYLYIEDPFCRWKSDRVFYKTSLSASNKRIAVYWRRSKDDQSKTNDQ